MEKLKQRLFLEIFVLMVCNLIIPVLCAGIRDPFYLPKIFKDPASKDEKIRLFGIIQSAGKVSAIISVDGSEETVEKNDKIAGYSVNKINDNVVVLVKGKKIKKLFLEG